MEKIKNWIAKTARKIGLLETWQNGKHGFFRLGKMRSHKLTDPKTIMKIWTDPANFGGSPSIRDTFEKMIPGSQIIAENERWEFLRGLFSEPLGLPNVKDKIAPVILQECREMTEQWKAKKDIPDLEHEMLKLMGNIIMRTIFGNNLPQEDKNYILGKIGKAISGSREPTVLGSALKKANLPYDHVGFLPSILLRATGIYYDLRSIVPLNYWWGARKVRKLIEKNVDLRRKLPEQPDDLVGHMIKNGLTSKDIASQALMFIVAGHETTAESMTFTLMEVMKDKEAQNRLRFEFNMVTKNGTKPLAGADFNKLKAAQDELKRAMHLHPPFYMLTREAHHDKEVDGIKFKKHDFVMADLRDMHAAHPVTPPAHVPAAGTSLPFGVGPHRCNGANLAMVEGALTLSQMFNDLDIELVSAPTEKDYFLTTRPKGKVVVRATAR